MPADGPRRPTQKCPGANAGDMNTTRVTSTNGARLTANAKPIIRSKGEAGVTGGFVVESQNLPSGRHHSSRYRKAQKAKARQRGLIDDQGRLNGRSKRRIG